MNSVILQAAARLLTSIILLASIYVLLRGHNESGGGFIGALIASGGFAFYKFAYGSDIVRESLPLSPHNICLTGLVLSVIAGLPGMFTGAPFLTGLWSSAYITGQSALALSTILLFDIGVYLVVVGAALILLLTLDEDI